MTKEGCKEQIKTERARKEKAKRDRKLMILQIIKIMALCLTVKNLRKQQLTQCNILFYMLSMVFHELNTGADKPLGKFRFYKNMQTHAF